MFVRIKDGLVINPRNVKYLYQDWPGGPVEIHFADGEGLVVSDVTFDEVVEKLAQSGGLIG